MFCPKHQDWLWGSPNNLSIGYPGSFPRLWLLGHKADHLRLSIAEVKTEGIHTSSRIHAFVQSRRTTLLLTNILDEVKKDQMGRACCTLGRREEIQTGSWLESMMEKRLRGRPRLGWEDDVKVNLQETELQVVDWSHLAQIMVKWLALVSKLTGLWFPFLD